MRFEVTAVVAKLGFVIVRQCETGTFELTEHPRLGGIAIHRQLEQPRAHTPQGDPDFTVWGFFPLERADTARFNVGDIVSLS